MNLKKKFIVHIDPASLDLVQKRIGLAKYQVAYRPASKSKCIYSIIAIDCKSLYQFGSCNDLTMVSYKSMYCQMV